MLNNLVWAELLLQCVYNGSIFPSQYQTPLLRLCILYKKGWKQTLKILCVFSFLWGRGGSHLEIPNLNFLSVLECLRALQFLTHFVLRIRSYTMTSNIHLCASVEQMFYNPDSCIQISIVMGGVLQEFYKYTVLHPA